MKKQEHTWKWRPLDHLVMPESRRVSASDFSLQVSGPQSAVSQAAPHVWWSQLKCSFFHFVLWRHLPNTCGFTVKEHMMTEAAGRRAVCSTSGVQTKLLSSFMPESVRASYSETIWAQEASFTLNSPESLVPLQLFFCCLNNGWAPHSWAWTHGRNVPTRPRMLHHAVYIIICHAEFQTCDCLQMTTHAHYWLIHLPVLGPVLLFTCMLLFP